MNEFENIKLIILFIDTIDPNTGWWYIISKIGINSNKNILEVFPTVNRILGMHLYATDIMWLETCYLKNKGDSFKI